MVSYTVQFGVNGHVYSPKGTKYIKKLHIKENIVKEDYILARIQLKSLGTNPVITDKERNICSVSNSDCTLSIKNFRK